MKNVSRFTALALVLLLLVSLCGAASASSGFFPDYQMLLDFCGGDTTKASAEMERYNAWYVTFISQYGDPSYSPYARSQFSSAAASAGFTSSNGFYFYTPSYPSYPYPYPYPQPQPCPYYPYYPYYPYTPTDSTAYAPVQAVAQPTQRAVRLAASQEEYAAHFLTGETSVVGSSLVFDTKSRDTAELDREDIYVTGATLVTSTGETFNWSFAAEGETVDTGIARLVITFGESCKATLTATVSNGAGSRDVECAERTISAVGGESLVVSITAYDINGNVIDIAGENDTADGTQNVG